ncbi:tail fiber assembly protein [Pantoea sp. KXB25]|uniref:tail fiber assembly protein n=1 Tax=unclassified Pantoea TaxID=2630326 RepID=UPI003AB8E6B9
MNTDDKELPELRENRYFIETDKDDYVVGMFVAICASELEEYQSRALREISEENYCAVGPDSLFINGSIVQGAPRQTVIDVETKGAILAAKIRKANEMIQMLQGAIDLKMATQSETEALPEWMKYRVLLSRINPESWADVSTPQAPENVA